MTQHDAVNFARQYLWDSDCFAPDRNTHLSGQHGGRNCILKGVIDDYHLHRNLQFRLCGAYQTLAATFGEGEITKKDIALIVEAWAMGNNDEEYACSQGERSTGPSQGHYYRRNVRNHPLVHIKEPIVSDAIGKSLVT